MVETRVPFEPKFGAFVLETLTIGMYGEPQNALREYIQNSFDAIRQAEVEGVLKKGQGRIEVGLSADRTGLTIRDNGIGLLAGLAAQTLAAVGSSSKDFRQDAGFRGIGRLSGIVFCDRITFATKAKGETLLTTVVFDAKTLREMMSPNRGSEDDAAAVLKKCVTATVTDGQEAGQHFFEVQLAQFSNAPRECTDVGALKAFLSQVSPIPYDPEFPFGDRVKKAATAAGLPIEEVSLTVRDGAKPAARIYKPYKKEYAISKEVASQPQRKPLSSCDIVQSKTGRWWAWIGVKALPGAFRDDDVRGIRVRLRNIQIDGTKVMQDLFASSEERRSHMRLSEWYIGEVFVRPDKVVPNARRDGFEEDIEWASIKRELQEDICLVYGKLAYKLSKDAQSSIEKLTKKVESLEKKFPSLKKTSKLNARTKFLLAVSDTQERIAYALDGAELKLQAKFRTLTDRLSELAERYRKQYGGHQQAAIDISVVQEEARDEVLRELITEFRRNLEPPCFTKARNIMRNVSGKADL